MMKWRCQGQQLLHNELLFFLKFHDQLDQVFEITSPTKKITSPHPYCIAYSDSHLATELVLISILCSSC